MRNSPNNDLALAASQGDVRAVDEVLMQLYPVVHKHLRFLLGFDRSTDDAVQEAMVQIYQALPRFRGDSTVRTWALCIASRTAKRYIGKEKQSRGTQDIDPLDLDLADDTHGCASQEWVELISLLQILPPKLRQAMVLMGIMGLTAKEAGRAMGVFANTASSRYRLARSELVAHMGESAWVQNVSTIQWEEAS